MKHVILMIFSLRAPEPTMLASADASETTRTATEPAEPMPSRPPPRGIGLMVPGGLLTALGTSVVIGASVAFARTDCSQSTDSGDCWLGLAGAIMMPIGVIGLAVGAPLLGVGVHRHRVWREWQREHGLTLRPQFGRSRGAWTMGLELRF